MSPNFQELSKALAPPIAPLGGLSATISIGGLYVRVDGLPEKIHEKILDRYSVFLTDGSEASSHTATIGPGMPSYLELSADGYLKIEEEISGGRLVLMSHNFAAAASEDLRSGYLLLSDPENASFSAIAIENYLLRIFAGLALKAGGFFLHSCGIEKGDKAYLFFGGSGSGKSAVATLSPELQVLSDDMVLVIPRDGRYYAASTPFWGALTQLTKKRLTYPVAGCYRIRKTTYTKCVESDPAAGLGMLVPCCPFLAGREMRDTLLIPNLIDFLKKTKVYELYLPLEPEFWQLINKEGDSK